MSLILSPSPSRPSSQPIPHLREGAGFITRRLSRHRSGKYRGSLGNFLRGIAVKSTLNIDLVPNPVAL